MKKMKSKDDVQKALDYAIYMMIAGNFKKCSVKSHMAEQKLYLHFCELQGKKREIIEDNCAYLADKVLMDSGVLPISIWDEEIKVSFVESPDNGTTSVIFLGCGWILEVTGFYRSEKKQGFSIIFTAKGFTKKGNVLLPPGSRR